MSLEKMLDGILADARAEADRIVREAEGQAEAVRAASRAEANDKAASLLEEAERQAGLEAGRVVTQARLEARVRILARKREIIDEVLTEAFDKAMADLNNVKRTVVLKDGRREETVDRERLLEELRSRMENDILEELKL